MPAAACYRATRRSLAATHPRHVSDEHIRLATLARIPCAVGGAEDRILIAYETAATALRVAVLSRTLRRTRRQLRRTACQVGRKLLCMPLHRAAECAASANCMRHAYERNPISTASLRAVAVLAGIAAGLCAAGIRTASDRLGRARCCAPRRYVFDGAGLVLAAAEQFLARHGIRRRARYGQLLDFFGSLGSKYFFATWLTIIGVAGT
jgi:hypothetical protein